MLDEIMNRINECYKSIKDANDDLWYYKGVRDGLIHTISIIGEYKEEYYGKSEDG